MIARGNLVRDRVAVGHAHSVHGGGGHVSSGGVSMSVSRVPSPLPPENNMPVAENWCYTQVRAPLLPLPLPSLFPPSPLPLTLSLPLSLPLSLSVFSPLPLIPSFYIPTLTTTPTHLSSPTLAFPLPLSTSTLPLLLPFPLALPSFVLSLLDYILSSIYLRIFVSMSLSLALSYIRTNSLIHSFTAKEPKSKGGGTIASV